MTLRFLMLCILIQPLRATPRDTSSSKGSPFLKAVGSVILLEGVAILGGLAAKAAPKVYGTTMIVCTPLAFVNGYEGLPTIAGTGGWLGLSIYNLIDSKSDHKSMNRRFKTNLIGVNAIAAAVLIFTSASHTKKKDSLNFGFGVQSKLVTTSLYLRF